MFYRSWLALALFQAFTLGKSIDSGNIEIDILFPREGEAYEPSKYTPLVLAIQNPGLAVQIDDIGGMIQFRNLNTTFDTDWAAFSNYTWVDHTEDDIFYFYWGTDDMNLEADWQLRTSTFLNNCSRDSKGDLQQESDFKDWRPFTFKTRKGGKPMDLVDATNNDTCSKTPNIVWSVDELIDIGQTTKCAKLSTSEPKSNTCRPKIDSDLEKRVHAGIKKNHIYPNFSQAVHFPLSATVSLSAAFVWLIYSIV